MANESRSSTTQKKEEDKLVGFYKDILNNEKYGQKEKFILQLINTKISQVDNNEQKTHSIRNWLYISIMALSGISTIVLALGLSIICFGGLNSKDIGVILTTAITFLSGLASFLNIQNYWLRGTVMVHKLKELRYRFAFAVFDHYQGNSEEANQKSIRGGASSEGESVLFQSSNVKPKDYLQTFLDEVITILGDEYWEALSSNQKSTGPETSK